MERDSCIFYRSFFEVIEDVPDVRVRYDCYKMLMDYSLNGIEPVKPKGILKAIWTLAKPQLDANWRRYTNGLKGAEHGIKGAEYGKFGGAPKGNQNARKNNPPNNGANNRPNGNDNINGNGNDNDNVEGEDADSALPAPSLQDRREVFRKLLEPYAKVYGREMIDDFFECWTEPSQDGTQMRFEMVNGWNIRSRLKAWADKEKGFNRNAADRASDAAQQRQADVAATIARLAAEDYAEDQKPQTMDDVLALCDRLGICAHIGIDFMFRNYNTLADVHDLESALTAFADGNEHGASLRILQLMADEKPHTITELENCGAEYADNHLAWLCRCYKDCFRVRKDGGVYTLTIADSDRFYKLIG